MKWFAVLSVVLLFSLPVNSELVTRDISYKIDTTTFKGFLAYDSKIAGKMPGVLVVHEWWGLNDFAKTQAKRIAGLGYCALAIDMYGNGKNTADQKIAGKMAGEVRGTPLMRQRVLAGLAALKSQAMVDTLKIGAIGFCFGGTSVLELAYSGAPVKGGVTFHAGIMSPTPDEASMIKTKLLILHGADDPFANPDTVARFQNALRAAKVDWEMVYFGNAVHGFTNPANGNDNSKGLAYNPEAAEQSWKLMTSFFKEIF